MIFIFSAPVVTPFAVAPTNPPVLRQHTPDHQPDEITGSANLIRFFNVCLPFLLSLVLPPILSVCRDTSVKNTPRKFRTTTPLTPSQMCILPLLFTPQVPVSFQPLPPLLSNKVDTNYGGKFTNRLELHFQPFLCSRRCCYLNCFQNRVWVFPFFPLSRLIRAPDSVVRRPTTPSWTPLMQRSAHSRTNFLSPRPSFLQFLSYPLPLTPFHQLPTLMRNGAHPAH